MPEIASQHKDNKMAIIAAYEAGVYSQREIGEYYQLHPTTIGIYSSQEKEFLILDLTPFSQRFA